MEEEAKKKLAAFTEVKVPRPILSDFSKHLTGKNDQSKFPIVPSKNTL